MWCRLGARTALRAARQTLEPTARPEYTAAMASEAVQSYQELQRTYERALGDYRAQEDRYSAAASANPSDPSLPGLYRELEASRGRLAALYEEVSGLRNSLAQERDQALKRAKL
jgi:hypothetical protein